MILFVQLIQIARAQTTWESMTSGRRHRHHHDNKISSVVASAITASATSMEAAQLLPSQRGPGASDHYDRRRPHRHPHHHHRRGGSGACFSRVKKLLGVDVLVHTAQGTNSPAHRRRENPFSRGLITNCKDFWCDPAPVLKGNIRGGGEALLGGVGVDYYRMYETPPRMRTGRGGSRYQQLAGEEEA